MPNEQGRRARIINVSKYPILLINDVVTADINNIKVTRNNIHETSAIKFEGSVSSSNTIKIPNNNLKRYFYFKLINALENNKIYLKAKIENSQYDSKDKKIYDISHSLDFAISDILENSNNLTAEVVGKLAGGKYYNKQGTDEDIINLFNIYCENNNLDNLILNYTYQ